METPSEVMAGLNRRAMDRATGASSAALASSVTNLTNAVTSSITRASSWMQISGARQGEQLLDRAATEIQQRSLSALNRIGSFTAAHMSELTRWVTNGLRTGLGGMISGIGRALHLGDIARGLTNGIRGALGGLVSSLGRALHGGGGSGSAGGGIVGGFTNIFHGLFRGLGGAMRFGLTNTFDRPSHRWRNRQSGEYAAGNNFGLLGNLVVAVSTRLVDVFRMIHSVVSGIFSVVGTLLSGVWNVVRSIGTAAVSRIVSLFSGLQTIFGALWGAIQTRIAAAVTTLAGWLGGLWQTLRGALTILWDAVLDVIRGAARGIGTMLQSLWGLIGSIPYAGPALQIAGAIAGVTLLIQGATAIGNALGTVGAAFRTLAGNVGGMISGVASSVATAGRTAVNAVVTGANRAFTIGGNILSGAANLGRSAAGAAGAAGSSIGGAISGAGGVGGIFGSLFSTAQAVVSTLAGFGRAVFTLVGIGAIGGLFAKAMNEATKAAMEFARNAQAGAAQTGLSLNAAASVLHNFKSFGIGQMPTENAGMFRMKSGLYGLPGMEAPDFVERLATRFQQLQSQGMTGQFMAQGMLRNLGLNSPQWQGIAASPVGALRSQREYGHSINATLGLTPADVRAYANEIPMFINRIGMMWDGLKMKLASVARPLLESFLGGATSWLRDNAASFGAWIETAVRFMFVKAPLIAMDAVVTITSTVQSVVSSIISAGDFLVQWIPQFLGGVVQWLADGLRAVAGVFGHYAPILIAGVANGLRNFGKMVGGWLISFGDWLESVSTNATNPFRQFILKLALGLDGMIDVLKRGAAQVIGLFNYMSDWSLGGLFKDQSDYVSEAEESMGVNDAPQLYNALRNWLNSRPAANISASLNSTGQNVQKTTADWADQWTSGANVVGQKIFSGLHNSADALDPSRGKGGNVGTQAGNIIAGVIRGPIDSLRNSIKPGVDNIADLARSYRQQLGTEEQRNAQFDELIRVNKEQAGYLGQLAQDKRQLPGNTDRAMSLILAAFSELTGRGALSR